jgi:uncharacterized protein YbjT (DUF2867 family)
MITPFFMHRVVFAVLRCHIVLGELGDEKSLSELVTGAQFVFHCAAIVTDGSPKEAYEIGIGRCLTASPLPHHQA